jgi:hypothetical protein
MRTIKCLTGLGRKVPLCTDHRFAEGNLKSKLMLRGRYVLWQACDQRQALS